MSIEINLEEQISLLSWYKRWITSRYMASTRDIPLSWPRIFVVSTLLEKQLLRTLGINPNINSFMVISISMNLTPKLNTNHPCVLIIETSSKNFQHSKNYYTNHHSLKRETKVWLLSYSNLKLPNIIVNENENGKARKPVHIQKLLLTNTNSSNLTSRKN